MSLEIYKKQLAEVEDLLSSFPGDKSLLKLREDILELITLTKAKIQTDNIYNFSTPNHSFNNKSIIFSSPPSPSQKCSVSIESTDMDITNIVDSSTVPSISITANGKQKRQKLHSKTKFKFLSSNNSKILNEKFEIPSHLLPLPTDTDIDRSRKRRTIKALKSKFRSRQKSAESDIKQKSWQDFMNKANKGRGVHISSFGTKSIFATGDGINAKVGVVSNNIEREKVTTIDRFIRRKRLRNDSHC